MKVVCGESRKLNFFGSLPLVIHLFLISAILFSHDAGQPTGFCQVGPDKWLLPDKFKHCANEMYNFEARPDDVFVCTYPRSGTTWTQEMVWLICNDLDYETAQKKTLNERFPFFE